MSLGQGYAARMAIANESSWGTGVAGEAIVPFSSEDLNRTIEMIESNFLDGHAARRALYASVIKALGNLSGELDGYYGYAGGFEYLLWAFAGGAGSRDTTNGLNQYKVADQVVNSLTLAVLKDVSVWELPGVKVNTLNIKGSAGGAIEFSADIIAKTLLRTGDSGIVNTSGGINGISQTGVPITFLFDDLIFRIGDQSDALASGDQLKIDDFSFDGNNNLSEPQFSTEDSSHTDSRLTLEPKRNGFRDVKLTFKLPRYESDQIFTWLNNDTALQADLKFSRSGYEFNILLPNIKLVDPKAPISGAELVAPTFEIIALRNNGQNTYMTYQDSDAITDEVGFEIKSGRPNPVDV